MTLSVLKRRINIFLFLMLGLNLFVWKASNTMQPNWLNVPPAPSERGAVAMALGDRQLAYRSGSITLQNFGDTGGHYRPFTEYNYKNLRQWFFMLHGVDPASEVVPILAGYYFGVSKDKEQLRQVVAYLSVVGEIPVSEKWRWLAHAVYLARHGMKDLDLALALAQKLARQRPVDEELPGWARQMPAFIMEAQGDEGAARQFMMNMLENESDTLNRNELNFLKYFLVERVGADPEAVGDYD